VALGAGARGAAGRGGGDAAGGISSDVDEAVDAEPSEVDSWFADVAAADSAAEMPSSGKEYGREGHSTAARAGEGVHSWVERRE